MKNRSWNNQKLISIIRNVAKEELLPRFSQVKERKKVDGSLITEADVAVQRKLEMQLKQLDTDILFLSEEMSTHEQENILLQQDKAIWVLDPLDGTTNFAAGIPYYAISLALIENGETVLGFVYDPERDECFSAEKSRGAKLHSVKYQSTEITEKKLDKSTGKIHLKDAVACIDLKRLPEDLAIKIVTSHPFRSQRSFGGVALDWCWLAAARFDVYLHGKQNIWDYAAGHLIFSETGGASSTLDGEPVSDYSLKPRSAVAAMDNQLFAEWCDFLDVNARD